MKRRMLLSFGGNRSMENLLVTLIILSTSVTHGHEWARFRGPNGQGVSHAETIPIRWAEKDFNWKVSLPGGGHSSPVVWKDKIFITSGDPKAGCGTILALSVSDGQTLWQKEYSLGSYRRNNRNSYATTTPTVDADHVYVLWPASNETTLVALDHIGNEVWKRKFDGVHSRHGAGSSPVVFEDIVVFAHEQEQGDAVARSAWIAVNRQTGQTRWRLLRENSAKMAYSTPCVYRLGEDKPQLVFTSYAHGITGVDLRTAEVIWEAKSVFAHRVVSSPVIAGELIVGTCGRGASGKQLVAVRPDRMANPSEPEEVYRIETGSVPYVPTSLAVGDLLFTCHDRGHISCLRSATGEQLWRQKPAGGFYASPVYAGGNLYCVTTAGEVVVVKAAPSYELLAINRLGERSHATPAISNGKIYLRTYTHLISIGGRRK